MFLREYHPSGACSGGRRASTMCAPDFPLFSPGDCGARFLRQQKAGASLFRGGSRFGRRGAETDRVIAVAEPEPISPELVLVSPELREQALATLPAIDPDALFVVAQRPEPEPEPQGSFAVALVSYVGEAVLLGALRGAALVAVIAIVAFLLAR